MDDGILISQGSYTREILKKFKMENCQAVSTPIECGTKLSKFEECEKVDPTYFKSLVGNDESAALVEIDDPLKTFLRGAQIMGGCNGLMCVFKNQRKDVFLLNPTTRKFRKIAGLPSEFPSLFSTNEKLICGFRYDEDVLSNTRFINITVFFASGCLHWMASEDQINGKEVIVGFDLERQQFKDIPFPSLEATSAKSSERILDDLEEYISILNCTDTQIDVWVMNYRGAGGTWYKALSRETHEVIGAYRLTKLVAFSRSDEDLLILERDDYNTKLVWYNLDQRTVKNIKIRGLPVNFLQFRYTESLLPLTEDEPLEHKPSIDKKNKN
ncbi:hypothetical protein AgCh_014785 [Apium graveolens]